MTGASPHPAPTGRRLAAPHPPGGRSGPVRQEAEVADEGARHKPERGRLAARGRSTDDGSFSTLLVVHEMDGSWTFHGLGAPGVTLPADKVIGLAEKVLACAKPEPMAWYMTPRGTHHGVRQEASLVTDCGGVYGESETARLRLDPGQRPPDRAQVCKRCAEEMP